jgi:hypothetical protein
MFNPPKSLVWDMACPSCLEEGLPEKIYYQVQARNRHNFYGRMTYRLEDIYGNRGKWRFVTYETSLDYTIDSEQCSHGIQGPGNDSLEAGPMVNFLTEVKESTWKWIRLHTLFDEVALSIIPWDSLSERDKKKYLRATRNGEREWHVKDVESYRFSLPHLPGY